MYSYEDRIRTVELYIKLGKRVGATYVCWGTCLQRLMATMKFTEGVPPDFVEDDDHKVLR